MKLRERCKIAKQLNAVLNVNRHKDILYKIIEYKGLKFMCGICMNTFNSEDSFRAYTIFEDLFVPLGIWHLSYYKYIGAYNTASIDRAMSDMIQSYNNNVRPIEDFEEIYHKLMTHEIPNYSGKIYLIELLIYMSFELEYFDNYVDYLELFKKVANEIEYTWKYEIIQRVESITRLVETGNLQAAHNLLLEWQNFTVRALKLPSDLLVEQQ